MATDTRSSSKSPVQDDAEPIMYAVQGTSDSQKPTPVTVRCCLCHRPLLRRLRGWCEECNTFPINVTPIRYCSGGHPIRPDGFCHTCAAFVLTRLDPVGGEWVDSGEIDRACSKQKNQEAARTAFGRLSGKGWPEKQLPLNERFMPRRWKRIALKTVGETPNGDRIVFPAGAADETPESEVPF